LQASRGRLQNNLDRVQLHWSTARYAPWQEGPLLQGLADQVLAGAVAELGVSNIGPMRLRRIQSDLAARGVPLRSLQVQLSLLAPEPIRPGGLVDVCRELGVELIAYSPLALGLLTRMPGTEPSLPSGPRRWLFRRLWSDLQPLLEAMAEIATRRDASPAAVALNWCRAHGALPIAGLRTVAQADSAGDALAWSLDEGERERLDQLALAMPPGARMPANPFRSD
jgi:pyridoxine 4-dehydrogenase